MSGRRLKAVPFEQRLADGGTTVDATDSTALDAALSDALEREPSPEPDIWERLDVLVDPTEFRPKLAPDIEVKVFRLRWGNDYAMAANPRDLVHFNLSLEEVELLGLMDGTRTVAEIVVQHMDESGDLDIDEVVDLVNALYAGGFFGPRPVDVSAKLVEAFGPSSSARRKAADFARTLSFPWSGADRLVRRVYPYLTWTFHPMAGVVFTLIAFAGIVAFVMLEHSGRFSLSPTHAPLESLVLLLLGFGLTFVHELAHALVVVHRGRRLTSAGFMIYFGSPAFFVDVSDSLMLDPSWRIVQAAAGPFSELVLAGCAAMALVLFPSAFAAPLIYRFVVINYFVIFLNLVPLLELDGYYVLADLIQVPDLRPQSLEFIQYEVWHKLRARERFSVKDVGLLLYGILGVLFTIFLAWTAAFFWTDVFGGLISGLWHAGIVGRVLLVLLGLFFGGPAIRGVGKLLSSIARRLRSVWRSVRFKMETRWRIEAAELIDAIPIFEDLPEDTLSDLAGRISLREVRPGQALFRQGDRADAFYVVRKGTIRIEEENEKTESVSVLRRLERGESFGELGLLEAAPRGATARAEVDTQVIVVDKGTFDRLLADAATPPELAPTLHSLSELGSLPSFAHLDSGELRELLRHGRWINAAPGDELVRQGDVGDAFFAIASGQADVLQDGAMIRRLGAGSYFGEIALLRDVPRTATVVARTPLRAFRLTREGFDRLLGGAFRRGTLRTAVDRAWEH